MRPTVSHTHLPTSKCHRDESPQEGAEYYAYPSFWSMKSIKASGQRVSMSSHHWGPIVEPTAQPLIWIKPQQKRKGGGKPHHPHSSRDTSLLFFWHLAQSEPPLRTAKGLMTNLGVKHSLVTCFCFSLYLSTSAFNSSCILRRAADKASCLLTTSSGSRRLGKEFAKLRKINLRWCPSKAVRKKGLHLRLQLFCRKSQLRFSFQLSFYSNLYADLNFITF